MIGRLVDDPEVIFFIAVPSAFFSIPFQHLREGGIVVAGPLIGCDVDGARASARSAFSWLPVKTTLPK
jgi:hypothetical protein